MATPPPWWVDGAPPGWVAASAGVPADAATLRHHANWSFTSTDATSALHPLGLTMYNLSVAPFDAALGDLYSATMEFAATETFEGVLGDSGGGSGGQGVGEARFWWGDDNSYAFFGGGGGAGNGGGPGSTLTWAFDVLSTRQLTANDTGFTSGAAAVEYFGLSTATYHAPADEQCSSELCADAQMVLGVCTSACAGDPPPALRMLTWAREGFLPMFS